MKPNGVLIIPTGIGCAIGGHAAANPIVKLIANSCGHLIINPNSVNASDINEMPENCLYTEGSIIDRFLEGKLNLREITSYNKILMVVNSINAFAKNSMNAGIWGLGANIELVELNTPLVMNAFLNNDGSAGGVFSGVTELVNQISLYEYDALAIQTKITCEDDLANKYFHSLGNMCNPWGKVEAITSHEIANKINKPVAHAPAESVDDNSNLYCKDTVYYQMAPEIISNTFTFCILKGLHRAPAIEVDTTKIHADIISNDDIDFMITPHGCWGRPHEACCKKNIPIIVVKENTTCFSHGFVYPKYDNIIHVNNYLEAAGVVMSMSAGVSPNTILLNK